MENFITINRLTKTRKALAEILNNIEPRPSVATYGRMAKGTKQVADLWREDDGTPKEFQEFCLKHFIINDEERLELFERFQSHIEQIKGHFHELTLTLSAPMQVASFKEFEVDKLFSNFDPNAHLIDDLFKTKIAFVALLNFKLDNLEKKLLKGPYWSRKDWAISRLMGYFGERVPASVEQGITEAYVEANDYIIHYNFYVENIEVDGKRLFEGVPNLISHWGLRDHLKALYPSKDPLLAQKTLYHLMTRVVGQSVPKKVIDNSEIVWNPFTDMSEPEPNTRYKKLLNVFNVVREEDKCRRENKTLIDRKFNEYREIPKEQVEKWLTDFLSNPVAKKVGKYVSEQLGRPLEPFDIWFNQFNKKSEVEKLDSIVKNEYKTAKGLETSIYTILRKLGFDKKTSSDAAAKIKVDPGRSAGHATGAKRREGEHRIRVRVPEVDGEFIPNYDAFNVFMHELGHGVEMFFSVHRMDHNLLCGVPNTAFTEALAFIFQDRDLEVLGIENKDELKEAREHLALFWNNFEIAGVSLIDLRIWQWMYKNPDANEEQLKNSVVEIANNVWNEYFSPIFGVKDQPILAIYSHIIYCFFYTPDYFIGSIVQHQLQEYLKDKNLAEEVERIFTLGNLTPDLWMQKAVGSKISIEPLIKSTEEALEKLK